MRQDGFPGTQTVSVVIPTYNGRAFIQEALESVFAQTSLPTEILVVDDASTDDTKEIVTRLTGQAPCPVKLLALPRNCGGPARPTNIGIAASSSDLIMVLDQDDVFAPTRIAEHVAALPSGRPASFVFSLCAALHHGHVPIQPPVVLDALRTTSAKTGSDIIPAPQLLRLLMQHGNFITGFPGFTFRRRTWAGRPGGLDESFRSAADYDFLCWLLHQGDALFLPRVLYFRRHHEENLSRRGSLLALEVARIQHHYLLRYPWILRRIVSPDYKTDLHGLAQRLAQGGQGIAALRICFLYTSKWGWDRAIAAQAVQAASAWLRELNAQANSDSSHLEELRLLRWLRHQGAAILRNFGAGRTIIRLFHRIMARDARENWAPPRGAPVR